MKLVGLLALTLAPAPSEAQSEECAVFPYEVELCTADAGLEGSAPRADGPTTYFAGPYGVILEVAPLSTTATTDPAFVRSNLDAYLAAQKGLADGLPVLERDRIDLGDRVAEQVTYALDGEGSRVIADSLILGDGFAVYLQTIDFADGFTDAHRAFHDSVLAALRLPPPVDPDQWMTPSDSGPPRPLTGIAPTSPQEALQ